MKIVDANVMRNMDYRAIHEEKIASIVLMEHAANALFQEIITRIDKKQKIYIVCGQGNNGGDGLALARMLYHHDYQVRVYCKDVKSLSNDANYEYECLKSCDLEISNQFAILDSDIIIDALFGSGLTRDITGIYAEVISKINQSNCHVISIDIASGIDSNNGQVKNIAVKADLTLSFVCYKLGNILYPGCKYCNEVKVLDIHMPKKLVDESEGFILIDEALCKQNLPIRKNHSHKGSYGKVLIVGGSSDMHGALYLCANACLQSGVGLCTLMIPDAIYEIIAADLKECMCIKTTSENGYFDEGALKQLQAIVNDYELIVIGNGMGRSKITYEMVKIALTSNANVIVDGDALYELGKNPSLLKREASTILTPHLKEMSYLTQVALSDIMEDKIQQAKSFIKQYPSLTLVLKDDITTIYHQNEAYLFNQGHHALAKGGSGDVLCGMIAGLYAQNKDAIKASVAAVYMHGYIATSLAKTYSAYSILGRDIIDQLKITYKEMEE